jgi:hypothetical protein
VRHGKKFLTNCNGACLTNELKPHELFSKIMKTADEKKSGTAPKKRVTWTFQPADDVQRAVQSEYGDITERRGELTNLMNDAVRKYLPDAIRKILEEDHQNRLRNLTGRGPVSSSVPSLGAGKFVSRALKAEVAPPTRRRKP